MMAERIVGIRELKAKLSGYILRLKGGDTIIITERGRPVGRILPTQTPVEERIQNAVRSGAAAWSGRPLKAARPVARLKRGAKSLADLVTENRD
ncbi:MAG: type II toxin-antitoxin system Phd/YefM family antitoxin [Vicinamibacterales bacterium]